MKKKIGLIFYCITLMLICQGVTGVAKAEQEGGTDQVITTEQETAIKEHCGEIKEQLKQVQKDDARTRVHLGGWYDTILTKFITPLNVRLVENNLSGADLVENQNDFAAAKELFGKDYINYQQSLEELVQIDCKEKPGDFYEKLDIVQQRRKIVAQDTLKLRSLISKHLRLVEELRSAI